MDDSEWVNGTVLEVPEQRSFVILDPLTKQNFPLLIGDILTVKPALQSNALFRLGARWVAYVDICGVVRQYDVRENYYLADVDDGTGQITCTIWRQQPALNLTTSQVKGKSREVIAVGEKLLKLASRSFPVVHTANEGLYSTLGVGDTVQVRGRLQMFRNKVNVSASYCRVIRDPMELLNSTLHAWRMKMDVYSLPYDPQTVVDRIMEGLQNDVNRGLLRSIQDIIETDKLFDFTALDLQLHAGIIQQIHVDGDMADDALLGPDCEEITAQVTKSSKKPPACALKHRVQMVIDQFLKDGIVFRSVEAIGGLSAYRYTLKDRRLAKCVCQIILIQQQDSTGGVSFDVLLEQIRLFSPFEKGQRPYKSISRQAVAKVLNSLIERSRIYIVNPNHYKLA